MEEFGRLKKQVDQLQVIIDSDTYEDIDYFDFENHFRGSREYIKDAQRIYLKYFEGRKNVLDLGCGRGEFVVLLKENGIGVTGVDMYAPYVEFCKEKGLPVVLADAIRYLGYQEQLDGVFLGQVVEHLSINGITEICRLAYDRLVPGNYLIIETPNPMSLAIYTNAFYIDPSHVKPVHPLLLQYLVGKTGFSDVQILFTDSSRVPNKIPKLEIDSDSVQEFNESMEKVEQLLFGSQDYAVIARK